MESNGKPPELHPAKSPTDSEDPNCAGASNIGNADSNWALSNTSTAQLANFGANDYAHRPVLDKTSLSGRFDFRYKSLEAGADNSSPPSILPFIDAMRLELDPAKALSKYFFIDHAEKPSPN